MRETNRAKDGISSLITVLLILLLVGVLAGTIFTSVNSTNLGVSAPSWFVTLMPYFAGIALILIVLRAIGLW
jgi:hypothetical protein